VAYSHTHAAGLIDLSRRDSPGGELLEPYLDRLEALLADLAVQASQRAMPSAIAYGTSRCDLAAQRDYYDEEARQFVCGYNPGGFADDTVVFARAQSESGQTLATIVNYACHPTTLAFSNTQISPDFPGAMREVVERVSGAPCVFLQGASGDLGPKEGFVGDPAIADRNGRQLGYAVLSGLEGLPSAGTCLSYRGPLISGATLGIWEQTPQSAQTARRQSQFQVESHVVPLGYRPELPKAQEIVSARDGWIARKSAAQGAGDEIKARDCHAMIERMDRQLTRLAVLPAESEFPFPLRLWKLGEAVWVAVEGEPYQVFQTSLRRRFPGVPIVVLTLANGSRCSYLPPAETYGKGIYQESIALLAPGSLERLIGEAETQIASLLAE